MKAMLLTFSAPVHFGAGRLTDSQYTCDAATIFSALYIEALRSGQDVAAGLLNAARSGSLALSDAFPYRGDVLYLPKPMLPAGALAKGVTQAQEAQDSRVRKAAKKLAFIPVERYADYLAGIFDPVRELERFNLGTPGLQAKVNLVRDRGGDAEPYFVGGYSFASNAGIYFITQGSYDIEPLLEQLGYAGLGGKRTSGYGRFTYRAVPFSLPGLGGDSGAGSTVPRNLLLSTSVPLPGELDDKLLEDARFKVVRKGGFVQSTVHHARQQKKRDLYAFAAGSAFSRKFEGGVFDVNATPGAHAVYRYARAMWMEV